MRLSEEICLSEGSQGPLPRVLRGLRGALRGSAGFSECGDPIQKNPRVRKIFVRNSGAGNGRANCMGAWRKCVLSAGKTHAPIKFLVLGGGGVFWVWGGGGGVPILFLWARGFF